jgi:hypothetical protein
VDGAGRFAFCFPRRPDAAINSDSVNISQPPQNLAAQPPNSYTQCSRPQTLRMDALRNNLVSILIETADNDYGPNIGYDSDDCNVILEFLNHYIY